jgi:hypothetical protein
VEDLRAARLYPGLFREYGRFNMVMRQSRMVYGRFLGGGRPGCERRRAGGDWGGPSVGQGGHSGRSSTSRRRRAPRSTRWRRMPRWQTPVLRVPNITATLVMVLGLVWGLCAGQRSSPRYHRYAPCAALACDVAQGEVPLLCSSRVGPLLPAKTWTRRRTRLERLPTPRLASRFAGPVGGHKIENSNNGGGSK